MVYFYKDTRGSGTISEKGYGIIKKYRPSYTSMVVVPILIPNTQQEIFWQSPVLEAGWRN